MSNNKSYYWRKLKGEIGRGKVIREITEDEKKESRDLRRDFFEKIEMMKLVKYKKVYNFPENLIPLKGYDFQRFAVTVPENQVGLNILNEEVKTSFKINAEDIEIHMYTPFYEILAISYRIYEPKGFLSILGLTKNLKSVFCLTFDTAISVPQFPFTILKEYEGELKKIYADIGLEMSDKSNVFTPTFHQLLTQNSNSLNALEQKSLNNFIQKIKVLQEGLPSLYFKTN